MSYFSFTCITPLDISVPNTFIVFSPAAPGEMVAGNEPELTLQIEYDYSRRCTEPLRQRGSFLGACQPNIECFHSRGQHLCKFIATKESVCIRKEFNSHRIGLGHQHGRRFIVLGHQYGRRDVM